MTEPEPTEAPETVPLGTGVTGIDAQLNVEFEEFYRKNTKPLVAFLLLQGAGLIDATEIVQDTMTTAYHRWRSIEHPRAWTYRTASRSLVRRVSAIHEDAVAEPAQSNPLLRDSGIELWEQHLDIADALTRLPPRQRQIMAWTLFDYTPTEIADELKMPTEAVHFTLRKARQGLRNHLTGKEGNR